MHAHLLGIFRKGMFTRQECHAIEKRRGGRESNPTGQNFTVASLLLPRRLLQPFHNVYAYCRWADDLADEAGGGSRALELLRWWREELLACYGGRPRHPVMIALRDTIHEFAIPQQPFLD